MIRYAFVDAAGYVTGAGSGPKLRDGAVELPEGVTPMASIGMRLVDGVFVPRPDLPDPVISQAEGQGLTISFADLPPSTVAEIIDAEIGVSLGFEPEANGLIQIELPDPGRYEIILTPPRPYLPRSLNVEVNP